MRAAVEGKGDSALALLGVTVLTDTDQSDLDRMGFSGTVEELVVRRAKSAAEIGVSGLVCSPLEVGRSGGSWAPRWSWLRRAFGPREQQQAIRNGLPRRGRRSRMAQIIWWSGRQVTRFG